jgi:hypothetical protein
MKTIKNKCNYLKKTRDINKNIIYYCLAPFRIKKSILHLNWNTNKNRIIHNKTIITNINTRCTKIYDIDYTTKKRIKVKNCNHYKEV